MRLRWPGFWGWVLVVLMLAGAFFIAMGVREFVTTQRFLAKASAADGVVVKVDKVVDHQWTGSGDRQRYEEVTLYYPVVRFVTASGQVVQYTDDLGEDPPAYQVGDSVRVLYDPANPQKARLDTSLSRWLDAAVPTIIGLVILVVSVVILLFSRESLPERRGRGVQAPVRGRRRRTRPTPPRSGAEPNRPPHREPTDDRPQDSKVRDE